MSTLQEFEAWPKLARFRDILVTEKIDGTNAAVVVDEHGVVRAQSRTRLITPENDNFGFARWVAEHAEELRARLGIGRHFGEWWGAGIQRRYGLDHKRFSLFSRKWGRFETTDYWDAEPGALRGVLGVVPLLYAGPFDTTEIDGCLERLKAEGSSAARGFMDPEGVVVFNKTSGASWKRTYDDEHKGSQAVES